MQNDNQNQAGMTESEKHKKTLSDYIADMVSLESHIEEALDRQLKEVADDPIALTAVQGFHDMVKAQRDTMKTLQKDYPPTAGSPIKEVGANLLGKAAGMIDRIRTEAISKAIRDDYTAFNLAAVSYQMLFTTAVAFGEQRVAEIAERHLTSYASAIQRANHLIGDIVVKELAKDGHQVVTDAGQESREMVDRAWQNANNQLFG
jgi:ferritin-like metal-binding protein YciE